MRERDLPVALPFSHATLRRRVKAGEFPRPIVCERDRLEAVIDEAGTQLATRYFQPTPTQRATVSAARPVVGNTGHDAGSMEQDYTSADVFSANQKLADDVASAVRVEP